MQKSLLQAYKANRILSVGKVGLTHLTSNLLSFFSLWSYLVYAYVWGVLHSERRKPSHRVDDRVFENHRVILQGGHATDVGIGAECDGR